MPRSIRESYLGLARITLQQKDYDKAWSAVKKCLNIERRYEEKIAEIYFYAGIVNEKKGNFGESAQVLQQDICAENISSDDTENYPYLVKAAHRMVKLNWIGIR